MCNKTQRDNVVIPTYPVGTPLWYAWLGMGEWKQHKTGEAVVLGLTPGGCCMEIAHERHSEEPHECRFPFIQCDLMEDFIREMGASCGDPISMRVLLDGRMEVMPLHAPNLLVIPMF